MRQFKSQRVYLRRGLPHLVWRRINCISPHDDFDALASCFDTSRRNSISHSARRTAPRVNLDVPPVKLAEAPVNLDA